MDNVITYSFGENFIERMSDFLCDDHQGKERDFSKTALVFGGKRPAMFMKRELAGRLKKVYLPPVFFSMDEFVRSIALKKAGLSRINEIDGCYLLYTISRDILPEMLKGRERFSQFFPWARELLLFIEQLDIEDIRPDALHNIQKSASIGYDVPENINVLLENIIRLRDSFHEELKKQDKYSRGLLYRMAAEISRKQADNEFERVCFCNLFYLHRAEKTVIKNYYDSGKATLFFQKDDRRWPVLDDLEKELGITISSQTKVKSSYKLDIYSGFDTHSQVCLAREILKNTPDKDKTVILLPEPDSVIPLLSEITGAAEDYNVSIGYPLKRSALYSLFELIFKAQETRKDGKYYTRDYLKAISHPLIKNLKSDAPEPAITRVLTHKIEEFLVGIHDSAVSGSLFIAPEEVEALADIYSQAMETLAGMGIEVSAAALKKDLCRLHQLLFYSWQRINDFKGFAACLDGFLNALIKDSLLANYPINLLVTSRMLDICREFGTADFSRERFIAEDIYRIFMDDLEKEMVAFSGSPLKGLQILGLFETRALNFENVIVMDMNEGILPQLSIYEPLIPREVMLGLGLNRLEKEDEIQRYQFMRLLGAAKHVHLIYAAGADKEKSRFIQELIWEKQKAEGTLKSVPVINANFGIKIQPEKQEVPKNKEMVEFLANRTFSASRINTYLNCPLRFYYQYVLGLEEKEDLLDDPEARDIGTFIHNLLENTYKPFKGRKPVFDRAFREYFSRCLEESFSREFSRKMKSDSFMLKEIVTMRMNNFLDNESRRDIQEIVCLEEERPGILKLDCGEFRFKHRIDRIDKLEDESLLILDYKTGSTDLKPASREKIQSRGFSRASLKETVKSFQLPLYYYFIKDSYSGRDINAGFYNLKSSSITALFKKDEALDKNLAMDVFMEGLDALIREMLDPAVTFRPDDENPNYCSICPYSYLCR